MSLSQVEEKFLHQCFQSLETIPPPLFDDLNISVSTFIITFDPNTNFSIENIFEKIPVADIPLEVSIKTDSTQIHTVAEPSTILLAKYKDKFRGNIASSKNAFRNQVTLVMSLDEKNVNLFVFRNKIKITGVKNIKQVIQSVTYFISHVQRLNKYFHFYENEPVIIDYKPSMTNVNFNIGFKIDRASVDSFLLKNGYISVYEPSVNSGVYLKIPRRDMMTKHHTFTIFHTGCILCSFSGEDQDEMKQVYNHVVELLLSMKNNIQKKFIQD